MSNAIVRAAFETRLKAWADAQNPKVPISFQNAPFTKPTSTPWVECFLVPNDTLNTTLDAKRKTLYGVFQVNCWVQQGRGMGQGDALAQAIVDLFPVVPKTSPVSVEGTPIVRSAVPDQTGWMIVPVLIRYRYESI